MIFDNIKVLFFISALIVQLLSLYYVKNTGTERRFLLSSLILTFILICVIIFKLHHFFRSEFNIPNTATYGMILLPFVIHFLMFKQEIILNNFILLLLSCLAILLAIILDLLSDAKVIQFDLSDLTEEIFRILGSAIWFAYYLIYSIKFKKTYVQH